MNIEIPKGYEIDKENSTFDTIKLKKIEAKLPKTWEELKRVKGYYVNIGACATSAHSNALADNRNIFPTKEQAQASVALAQLFQLRDVYRDGWVPDWVDNTDKYVIKLRANKWTVNYTIAFDHPFAFKTIEIGDEFFENFKGLLEQVKPLFL